MIGLTHIAVAFAVIAVALAPVWRWSREWSWVPAGAVAAMAAVVLAFLLLTDI